MVEGASTAENSAGSFYLPPGKFKLPIDWTDSLIYLVA